MSEKKTLTYLLYGPHEAINEEYITEEYQYIVPKEDVEEMVFLGGRYLKVYGAPGTDEGVKLIDELLKDADYYEAQERLEEAGYEYREADEYEAPLDVVVWSEDIGACLLSDCETHPSYPWWDGSNWRREWPEDTTEVVVEETPVNLDTCDERGNWRFRYQWQHGKLYTVLTIDGEPADGKYLLVVSSDYQGSHDVARLVDSEERFALYKEGEVLLSTAEAAEVLGISERRVRALCAAGRMGRQVGTTWVITPEEIEANRVRKPGRPAKSE